MTEHPRWGEPLHLAGRRFEGRDGQAYELVKDVFAGEYVAADQFRPLGGAPDPMTGELMPEWFSDQLSRLIHEPFSMPQDRAASNKEFRAAVKAAFAGDAQ